MLKYLKDNAFNFYRVAILVVLVGKISNWFLNYSDETNKIINTTMFCLIGIMYLFFSWALDKIIHKLILGVCGLYIIIMNFIPSYIWNSILGIVCLIVPLIIGKFFLPDLDDDDTTLEKDLKF